MNHKDGRKDNNEVRNLEWVTHKENTHHAIATGLMRPTPPAYERKPTEWIHGVYTSYQYRGCKCLECKAAYATRKRKEYRRKYSRHARLGSV